MLICLSLVMCGPLEPPPIHRDITYNRDIRPILSENCFHCHGPDGAAREAGLRLDRADAAYEWALVPGDGDGSEVVSRIESNDADLQMPPADSGRSLSDAEKVLVRQWVEAGAEYEPHWSFVPPERPAVPEAGDPVEPIDRFIADRLKKEGLSPAAPAERAVWLRRVTFDLTGLPPTIGELDAFEADTSEAAKERVVERLLASPRFGERMAVPWLDAARYSDTYGYQVDRDRRVWPWRDWVIDAFNRDLPYDEFLTHQLAGDLLPPAETDTRTRSQIVATAFNRLHPQKVEGGSVPEEFRIEYVSDRAQTVSTAFLGLTMECCRCHDHKYDPITQREYFEFTAFFDNIDEAGLYSYFTDAVPTPAVDLPTKEQGKEIAALTQDVHAAQTRLRQLVEQSEPAEEVRLREPIKRLTFDDGETNVGGNTLVDGHEGQAVRLTGDDAVDVGVGNFKRSQPFSVSLWLKAPDEKQRAVIFHRSKAWTDAASRGYELLIEDGRPSFALVHFEPGNGLRVRGRQPLPIGQWVNVVVTYDGSATAGGVRLFIDGEPADVEVVRDGLTREITGGGQDTIVIGERMRDFGFKDGLVDDFQVFDVQLSAAEAKRIHDPVADLTAADRLDHARVTVGAEARAALTEARTAVNAVHDHVPALMVMKELPHKRQTRLLSRGVYDQPAEPVDPGTPAALAFRDGAEPRDRLELARELTAPRHPLTSRVAVNRLWQTMFGRGLVETAEDFGTQGSPPSHPELLDWLAVAFVESGWDVKAMLKRIALSETYGRSGSADASAVAADPQNKLLARGPRTRLTAEMLRDAALFTSGLLVEKIGGPPVKPYEVEASFKPAQRDAGEGLYRRSLYTYWRRTAPAPAMMTLDAAKRDVCQVRRDKTTTPLQSLVLLNGPQYAEAARVLAEQVVRGDGGDADRVARLFRRLTSQRPTEAQRQVLLKLLSDQRAAFADDPAAASKFRTVGERPADESLNAVEVAAWTGVVQTLMNYDGFLTKR